MKTNSSFNPRGRVRRQFSLLSALCPTLFALLFAAPAQGQWRDVSYTLKGGWNAISVPGDASHQTVEANFPATGPSAVIQEIWRWNPNPDQVQFTSSSLMPATGTPEWSVWRRSDGGGTSALGLITPGTYLVKCSGASTTTHPSVALRMAARLPDNSWVRNGANLFGFPTSNGAGSYPLFSNYFASFPTAIATGTRIYKYVGGDLGTTNPLQIFSPSMERVDATQAYWFSAETVGTFSAPLEVSLSTGEALDFGRTSSEVVLRLTNTTSSAMNVNLFTEASAEYPAGYGSRANATNNVGLPNGVVPLTLRTLNGSGVWTDTPITGTLTQAVAAKSTVELRLGIQRNAMTATLKDTLYTHCLRIKDAPSAALFDLWVPVKARSTDLTGLWMGEALVSAVESKAQSNAVTPVSRPFPLRMLLHVDSTGVERLLSQVYLGRLAAGGTAYGICTKESGLLASDLKNARRLSAAHLPLDSVVACTGTVALPSTLTATIAMPRSSVTNPFVHKYHPDHKPELAYDVTRHITLEFTKVPPGEVRVFTIVGGSNAGLSVGMHADFFNNDVFTNIGGPILKLIGTDQFEVGVDIPRNGTLKANIWNNNVFFAQFNGTAGSPTEPAWGSTVIGGIYTESIHGIHRDSAANGGDGVQVRGTFELRRVSEIGTLSVTP